MSKNWFNPYYVDKDNSNESSGSSISLKAYAGSFPDTISDATSVSTTAFAGLSFDDGETFYNRILNLSGDGISSDGLDIQRYPHVDDVVRILLSKEIHGYIVDMVDKAAHAGAPVVAGYTPNGGFTCYVFSPSKMRLSMGIGGSNDTVAKTLTSLNPSTVWKTALSSYQVNGMNVPAQWDSANNFSTNGTSFLTGGFRISLMRGSSTVYIVAAPTSESSFKEYAEYTSPIYFAKLPEGTSFPVTKQDSEMVPLAIMSAHTGVVTMGDLSSITYNRDTRLFTLAASTGRVIGVKVG